VADLPCHAPTSKFWTGAAIMKNQSTRVMALSMLACSAFALCVFASQPAMADGRGNSTVFTNSSLQGSYAYVNNTANVASLGPITFDGDGGLSLQLVTNVPCETPEPGCSRGIGDFDVVGDYSVEPDGTGVATIDFGEPFGPVTFDFVIVEANRRGPHPLAIEVFAVGRSGGLAGQLIAPTWTRIFDK
jgi:hypothetical protein